MTGLQYILNLYGYDQTKLAQKLGTTRQNVNLWVRLKQNVPAKYLRMLEELFKIDSIYFSKKLTEKDEKIIRLQRKIRMKKEFELALSMDLVMNNDDIDRLDEGREYLEKEVAIKKLEAGNPSSTFLEYIAELMYLEEDDIEVFTGLNCLNKQGQVRLIDYLNDLMKIDEYKRLN